MERFCIKVAPNREIRLSQSLSVSKRSVVWDGTEEGYYAVPCPEKAQNLVAPPLPSLDISPEFQRGSQPGSIDERSKTRPGWGELPKESRFGVDQKRAMLRAGAVCDGRYGLRQIVLTGTLPGSTNEANYALACWSGYAMNRVLQWVRRIVGENWTFGVWEYQKRGALHYHLAVCYESEDQAVALESGFKGQWYKVLCDISERSEIDLFRKEDGASWRECPDIVQADSKRLRKSCAAYFSKYASKGYGVSVAAEMRKSGLVRFCPSRWIVLSRPVSRAIKEQSFAFQVEGNRGTIERLVQDWLHRLESESCLNFAYKHKVIDGKTWVFYFEDCEFEALKKEIKDEFQSEPEDESEAIQSPAKPALCVLSGEVSEVLGGSQDKLQKQLDRWVQWWQTDRFRHEGILAALGSRVSRHLREPIPPRPAWMC